MSEMEKIGTSSLWEYRYRPLTVKDLILPEKEKTYFNDMVQQDEIDNLILTGTAGRGKTSVAYALCNDVGASYLYINGSIETGIDVLRNQVTQFATSHSLDGNKKVLIFDEFDRLSANAMDGLKALIEITECNCRFIFTTNNINKIIEPVMSRCKLINFNFSPEDSKKLMVAYFKRLCWILDREKVSYDKKPLAEFVQQHYPDFRKTLNKLQMLVKMNGCVDDRILAASDSSKIESLVDEMKNKKWNNVRKIISELDFSSFYTNLYHTIEPHLKDESKPSVILVIGEWQWKAGMSNDKELACVCCATELMKEAKWR